MKDELSKEDILNYLKAINDGLVEQNKYGEITLYGGAVFTLVYQTRNSTYDIDAYFKPKEDMKKIIDSITLENNLNQDWMNDDVLEFVTDDLKTSKYLGFSNLSIMVVDAESLLCMKLIAARPDNKDKEDAITLINHLKIKNVEQLYVMIDDYRLPMGNKKVPLHPKEILICREFAERVFDEYIKESHNGKMSLEESETPHT